MNTPDIDIDIGIYLSKIYHNATKTLKAGDILQVTLVGSSLGTATFDIGTLTAGVSMTDNSTRNLYWNLYNSGRR